MNFHLDMLNFYLVKKKRGPRGGSSQKIRELQSLSEDASLEVRKGTAHPETRNSLPFQWRDTMKNGEIPDHITIGSNWHTKGGELRL